MVNWNLKWSIRFFSRLHNVGNLGIFVITKNTHLFQIFLRKYSTTPELNTSNWIACGDIKCDYICNLFSLEGRSLQNAKVADLGSYGDISLPLTNYTKSTISLLSLRLIAAQRWIYNKKQRLFLEGICWQSKCHSKSGVSTNMLRILASEFVKDYR